MRSLTGGEIDKANEYPSHLKVLSMLVSDLCSSDTRVNENAVAQRALLAMLESIDDAIAEYESLQN